MDGFGSKSELSSPKPRRKQALQIGGVGLVAKIRQDPSREALVADNSPYRRFLRLVEKEGLKPDSVWVSEAELTSWAEIFVSGDIKSDE